MIIFFTLNIAIEVYPAMSWNVLSGHLAGCGKKSKIMRKFGSILCVKFGELRG